MVVGSGIAASVGIGAETAYGTYAAPTRFLEFDSEDIKKIKNTVQGGGLAGGRLAQLGSRRVVTTEAAGGTLNLEIANKGLGLLLKHLMGGSPAAVQQGATVLYLQSYPLADNVGSYLTLQEGVPDATGVIRPQTFKGGKIVSAEFSCGVDELLTAAFEFDFQRYSEAETLAAPSYSIAGLTPFSFASMTLKMGTFGSETAMSGVKKVTAKIERPQAVDRFYANAAVAGTKAEPLMNDWVSVSGSIDADLVNKADFADRFHTDAQASLVWEFLGATVGAFRERFTLRVPAVFLDGDTPVVAGPDVTTSTFPFVGQLDAAGSSLVTIDYVSTDTTA